MFGALVVVTMLFIRLLLPIAILVMFGFLVERRYRLAK